MISLRHYQQNAITEIKNSIKRGNKRIVLQASTGAGKTIIACSIIKSAIEKNSNVLFIAHRREILVQTSEKLSSFGVEHGVIMGSCKNKNPNANVQIASIQTVSNRAKSKADILIIDEGHLSLSKSFLDLIAHYPDAIILCLTATPVRTDGRGLGEVYSDLIQVVPMRQLIEEGFLVKPRVFAPFTPDMTGVKTSKGDFDATQTAQVMDKSSITGDIIKHWEQHAKGRKTICFATGIEHSKHIVEQFINAGIDARHLDGTASISERESIFNAWKRGEFLILSNVGLYVEGMDFPECSCCILARPTLSTIIYLQSVGRAMRPFKDKKDCIILDHAGCTHSLGFITQDREWSLDAKKKKKGKDKAPAVKVCESCFAAYPAQSRECPECGHVPESKQVDVAQLTNGDGFLVELQDSHIRFIEEQRIKEQKKNELKAAKTTEQLIELGRIRNYKNPYGWAQKIQQQRHQWTNRHTQQGAFA